MPFRIVRNDITRVKVDAIVNTANPHPVIGAGVDSAIHRKAGPALLAARQKIGDIAPGSAAVTPAFQLPAKFVIHTVGPIWRGGAFGEAELLAACYRNSLARAVEQKCASIAFPLISTGTYGFPKDLALQIAVREIGAFVLACDVDVTLVVLDPSSFALSEKLSADVRSYVDDNYARRHTREAQSAAQIQRRCQCMDYEHRFKGSLRRGPGASIVCESALLPEAAAPSLKELLKKTEASFSCVLFRLIAERHLSDPDVYKRANIDRKLFSKIRSHADYKPRKATCLALAVALRLTIEQTRDFIGRAGYLLTHSSQRDIVVEYFIGRGKYDIFQINQVLFSMHLPLIGP